MNIELLSLKNCEIDLISIFRHKIDNFQSWATENSPPVHSNYCAKVRHEAIENLDIHSLILVPKVSKSATSSRTSSPSTLPTSSSIYTLKLWSSLKRFLLKLALEIILYRIIPGLGSTSSRKSETSVLSPREPRDRQLRLKWFCALNIMYLFYVFCSMSYLPIKWRNYYILCLLLSHVSSIE